MEKSRKTVVVTGASKGLGLGIVTRLAQEGYDIIAHYNSCLLYTSPSPRD